MTCRRTRYAFKLLFANVVIIILMCSTHLLCVFFYYTWRMWYPFLLPSCSCPVFLRHGWACLSYLCKRCRNFKTGSELRLFRSHWKIPATWSRVQERVVSIPLIWDTFVSRKTFSMVSSLKWVVQSKHRIRVRKPTPTVDYIKHLFMTLDTENI